jgi:ferredoxin
MKLIVDPHRCRASGECVKACPEGAIAIIDGIAVIDENRCDFDGICIAACPHQAIDFSED